FHSGSSVGRDISRLRFMAEKTVEAAHVPGLDREQMLEQRHHQIDQVGELMRTRSCMRTAISEYFQGPKAVRRPSLSVRILDWAFGSRRKTRRFQACCDHCNQAEIKRRGMAGYVARVIAGY
ncbi:MAG: DNA helicase, partial [Mesorhizobium sp.]